MATGGEGFVFDLIENEKYNFCIYAVDQQSVLKDDTPCPQNGEVIIVMDPVTPVLRILLDRTTYIKKGILMYNPNKKDQQER